MAVEKSPEPASQQAGDDLGKSPINMTNEDGEKGSAVEGYDVYVDPVLEKKVLRRLDKRFAPLFCALYFMAYLDRSNIGNAAVAGLRTDLGLTGPQFSVAVSVFFATYVVFMVPFVLAQRWLKTHRAIAAMACAWSVVTICTAFVTNVSTFFQVSPWRPSLTLDSAVRRASRVPTGAGNLRVWLLPLHQSVHHHGI
jgi:hypothetical protein